MPQARDVGTLSPPSQGQRATSTGQSWCCLVRVDVLQEACMRLAGSEHALCWHVKPADVITLLFPACRRSNGARRLISEEPRWYTYWFPRACCRLACRGTWPWQLALPLSWSVYDMMCLFVLLQVSVWQAPPMMCTCSTSALAPGPRLLHRASLPHPVPHTPQQLLVPW